MENYIQLTLAILAVVVSVLVVIWRKWSKTKRLLKELAEALTALSIALEDDNVTKEEVALLAQHFADAIEAAIDLCKGV